LNALPWFYYKLFQKLNKEEDRFRTNLLYFTKINGEVPHDENLQMIKRVRKYCDNDSVNCSTSKDVLSNDLVELNDLNGLLTFNCHRNNRRVSIKNDK